MDINKKLNMLIKYGVDSISFNLLEKILGENSILIEQCDGECLLDIAIRRRLKQCALLICNHIKSTTNEPAKVNFFSIYNNKFFELGKDITISRENLLKVDFSKYKLDVDLQRFLLPLLSPRDWFSLENVDFIFEYFDNTPQNVEDLLFVSSKSNLDFLLYNYFPTRDFIHLLIKNCKWNLLWYIFVKWPIETQQYAIKLTPLNWPYFSKTTVDDEVFFFELAKWLLLSLEDFFKETSVEVLNNILYMGEFLEERFVPFKKVHCEILPQIPLCDFSEYFYSVDFRIKYNIIIYNATEWELDNIFQSISSVFKNFFIEKN